MPKMSFRGFLFSKCSMISSRVYSPSPITIMSTAGFSSRNSLGMVVVETCGPPTMVRMFGLIFFVNVHIFKVLLIWLVKGPETPMMSGLRFWISVSIWLKGRPTVIVFLCFCGLTFAMNASKIST